MEKSQQGLGGLVAHLDGVRCDPFLPNVIRGGVTSQPGRSRQVFEVLPELAPARARGQGGHFTVEELVNAGAKVHLSGRW